MRPGHPEPGQKSVLGTCPKGTSGCAWGAGQWQLRDWPARGPVCPPPRGKSERDQDQTSAELVSTGEAGCREVSARVGHAPEMVCLGVRE